tara:strand:+ start:3177 stop:4553 length:1377 start_codon:yes stop_codon:yes gene_type:complete
VATFEEQLAEFAKKTAEFEAANKLSQAFSAGLKENKIAALGYFSEVQKAQVEAAKTIGLDFNPAVDRSIKLFGDLNEEGKNLGVTLEQTRKAVLGVAQTFAGTADSMTADMDKMNLVVARLGNVIDRSKLISFTKNFALQTDLSGDGAAKFGEKLTKLAVDMKRPPATLVELSQSLLNTGVLFGSTEDKITRLTYATERFGKAIGASGKEVQGVLGGMMMIDQRQQMASRLAQIGQQVGADIDISKILSSDPAVQLQGVKEALSSFSDARKGMAVGRQQAMFLALRGAIPGLPGPALQAALMGQTPPPPKKTPGELGDLKGFSNKELQAFVTASTKLQQQAMAARMKLGKQQLESLNSVLKLSTSATKANSRMIRSIESGMLKVSGKTITAVGEITEGLTKLLASAAKAMADGTFGVTEAKKLTSDAKQLLNKAGPVLRTFEALSTPATPGGGAAPGT